jgi:hypothetical protein
VAWVGEKLKDPESSRVERRLDAFLGEVRVAADAKHAVVTYGKAGEHLAERALSADSCNELLVSIALISAMALETGMAGDPGIGTPVAPDIAASLGRFDDEPSPREADDGSPIVVRVEAEEASPTKEPQELRTARQEKPQSGSPDPQAKSLRSAKPIGAGPSDAASPLKWGATAGIKVDSWTGANLAWGGDFGVRLSPPPGGLWVVRASVHHARSEAATADGREAKFRAFGAGIEACVAALRAPVGIDFELCGRTTAGVLYAEGIVGSALIRAERVSVPVFDAAALVRGLSPPWGPFRFEIQAELGSALVDHRFEFTSPEAVVFHQRQRLRPGSRIGGLWEW